jgi:DNA-binding transcriptional ArsR family regulator
MRTDRLAVVMKALSSEPRLKILQLLRERSLCVNMIARKLSMKQSAVSQHLRIMKEAGVLKAEKSGYWVHYSVDRKSADRWRSAVDGLFSDRD